ncbi:MAG: GNAT family N-acetyltransferase [Clostridia bacterium]|nr:GNAT family N-acetyltransferase [Clostridia bacterium]
MKIRHSAQADVLRIMEIYAGARAFMAAHSNPNQWGKNNWPPEGLIENDIKAGHSYVCENEAGRVVGTFYFIAGHDVEPTYLRIYDGAWADDTPYGVVHRIASDYSQKGIGSFCLKWAFEQCGHIRIDTHGDNYVMQSLLKKLGYEQRGIIYVEQDDAPRIAYEKSRDM